MKSSKWNTFRAECVRYLSERMSWWRETDTTGGIITCIEQNLLDVKLLVGFHNETVFDVRRRFAMTYMGAPFWVERQIGCILVSPDRVEVIANIFFAKVVGEDRDLTLIDKRSESFSLDDFHGRTRKILSEWRTGWFPKIEKFLDDPHDVAPFVKMWAEANLVEQFKF